MRHSSKKGCEAWKCLEHNIQMTSISSLQFLHQCAISIFYKSISKKSGYIKMQLEGTLLYCLAFVIFYFSIMLPFNVVSALFPKQPQVTCQSVYNTRRSTLTIRTALTGPSLDHWNHPCLWGRSYFQTLQAGPSPLVTGVWPWSTHSSSLLPEVYERPGPYHYPHNYNDCKFVQHFKLTGSDHN